MYSINISANMFTVRVFHACVEKNGLSHAHSTQDKGSILSPQKIAEALILLQISLNDKHYCLQ